MSSGRVRHIVGQSRLIRDPATMIGITRVTDLLKESGRREKWNGKEEKRGNHEKYRCNENESNAKES